MTVSGTAGGFDITDLTLAINDTDTAPTAIVLSLSQAGADEGASPTVTVTATLSPDSITLPADTPVSVTVGDSGDSATEGTDYTTVADLTVTIAAGATSGTGTFEFAVTDDEVADPGETVTVSGTAGGFDITDLTLAINDTDTAPTVIMLSLSQAGADEGASPTVTVTATLSPDSITLPADTPVSVTVGDSGDSATEGTDYTTVADLTVTIAAGATSGTSTFEFAVTDDEVADPGETVTVSGSAGGFAITDLTLAITDTDTAPTAIVLSLSQAGADEGASPTVTVTATLSPDSITLPADTPVSVTVGDSGDSATEGTDYTTVADLTVTIAAGATSGTGTFEFAVTDDEVADPGETVTVSGTAGGFDITDLTLAINDTDTAPTAIVLSLSQAGADEGASATVTMTATLSPSSITLPDATVVTVAVGAGGDSATEGTDYTTVADLTVTIAAGATSGTGTFEFAVTDDEVADPGETVTVSGTAGGFDITDLTLAINDTDTAPTVIMLSLSQAGADEGASPTVTVTATFSPDSITLPADTPVSVTVGDSGDSATEGTDYTMVDDLTVTIAAGATSGTGTFQFASADDAVADPGETVTVSGTAGGFTFTNTTLAINDTDTAPTAIVLGLSQAGADEGASPTVTVTATLSPSSITLPDATVVTVAVGAGGDSATEGTDYTMVDDLTVTISAGATSGTGTFQFAPTDDAIADPGETVTVSGTAGGFDIADLTLAITDTDTAPTVIVLSLSEAGADEGASATVTVTATLSPSSITLPDATVVTVAVGADGDSATEGTDYTMVDDLTVTIAAGSTSGTGTFQFAPVDDAVADPNETVTVSGTAGGFTFTNATLAINDTDTAPSAIVLSLSQADADEGASATVTVTATLSPSSITLPDATVVTVAVGAGGDSATEGTDYATVADFTVTIAVGTTSGSGTFDLVVTSDTLVEGNETLTVSGLADLSVAPATLTITDDDIDPTGITLVLSPPSVLEGSDGSPTTNTITVRASFSGSSAVRTTATKVTVSVAVGGTRPATGEGTDFATVRDFTVTIDAGATSGSDTFDLVVIGDTWVEGPESLMVSGLADLSVARATMTITDDDIDPTGITLAVGPTSVREGSSGSPTTTAITVRASFSGSSSIRTTATEVTVSVAGGSATGERTDFTTVSDFTVTIDAGAVSGSATFDLVVTGDTLVEGPETLTVSGSADLSVAPATLTITDDDIDPTGITLAVGPTSVLEGSNGSTTTTAIAVRASFSGSSSTRTTATEVTVSVAGVSATGEGTDFATVSDFTVAIDAGAISGSDTFDLEVTGDTLVEGPETLTVSGLADLSVAPATLTIADDDLAPTGITLAVSPTSVPEGSSGSTTTTAITVTASFSGSSSTQTTATEVTVSVAGVSATGEGTDFATVSDFTVTIDAEATSGSATFDLVVTGDTLVEGPEILTVSGSADLSVAPATLTITDDDLAPTGITLAASPTSMSEGSGGGTMTITATLNNAVQGGLTVIAQTTDGTAIAGSDYTTSVMMMTFAGTAGEVKAFLVTVIDDNLVEGDETFIVSMTGTDTHPDTIDITATMTVTIIDDDTAPTEVVLSLTPTRVAEDSGITTITVTAAYPGSVRLVAATEVTVSVAADTASAADFTAVSDFTLTIAALSSSSTGSFDLTVTKDEEIEGNETLTVSGAATGFAVTSATLTVLGNNGALEALLPELARLSLINVLDKVVGRIEQVVSGVADPSARFAGHTSLAPALAANQQVLNDGEMSWREVLGRSSFAVQLDDTDVAVDGPPAPGGPAEIWVVGDYERASNKDDELGAWSGGLFTLHAGVDKRLSGDVLAGLSAFWSQGRFDFSENGSLDAKTLLAGLLPYIAWYSEDGSTLWATAGSASGTFKQDAPGTERDLAMRMLAIGGSRNIVDGTGLTVDLKGEVSGAQLAADAADGFPAMTADVHHLRLALEAGHVTVHDSGAQMTKSLALGVRHDGGDGETGFGAEVDGEMSWSNPASGVALSIIGGTLLAHEGDIEEWGLGGRIRYAPTPAAGRGLSLQAEPVYGRPETDSGQIWKHRVTDLESAGDKEPEARLAVDASYGLPVLTGRALLIPYAGLELSEEGDRAYRLGGRFETGSGIHIDLGGGRTEEDDGGPEYGIHLAIRMHW